MIYRLYYRTIHCEFAELYTLKGFYGREVCWISYVCMCKWVCAVKMTNMCSRWKPEQIFLLSCKWEEIWQTLQKNREREKWCCLDRTGQRDHSDMQTVKYIIKCILQIIHLLGFHPTIYFYANLKFALNGNIWYALTNSH